MYDCMIQCAVVTMYMFPVQEKFLKLIPMLFVIPKFMNYILMFMKNVLLFDLQHS